MEESEKRKQRLQAMRLEATAQSSSSSSSTSQQTLISSLSNPLLDIPHSTPTPPPPRFDYYTDPMSAYASDKRRPFTPTPPPSSPGPRNHEMHPVGAPQFQHNYAPHQGMYQGGHSPGMLGPTSSPMGIRSPFPIHQGNPNISPAPERGPWFNNYPSPGSGCGGIPYPVHQGSPNFRSPQGRGHWSGNSPNPNPGRAGGPSPSPGRGGGPSPSPGRGRGQWHGSRMTPNSGYSGGRGRGRGYGPGRSLYHWSMVEDPWESLTPVLWQGEKENDVRSFANRQRPFKGTPPFYKTPPFQKTPIEKKPRVSNPFDASNSKQSLAEFLSETFEAEHEAVEDAATV